MGIMAVGRQAYNAPCITGNVRWLVNNSSHGLVFWLRGYSHWDFYLHENIAHLKILPRIFSAQVNKMAPKEEKSVDSTAKYHITGRLQANFHNKTFQWSCFNGQETIAWFVQRIER